MFTNFRAMSKTAKNKTVSNRSFFMCLKFKGFPMIRG